MVETVGLNSISFHQIPPNGGKPPPGREKPPLREGVAALPDALSNVFFRRRLFSCFYAFPPKTGERLIKT
jgi:hypothetical protein